MNKRKLLAMKRRTLCHELGHALYFLKEIEPVYYVKERNICGIDVKRQSTLHVYLADDGFRGVFHSNGFLFHNETQVPAEINVCYTLAGYAMENAIYYHGLAMLPFDKIFEEAEEGDDFDLICNLIEKGAFNGSAEDLWHRMTLFSLPYRNKIYKQVLAMTQDIEKLEDDISLSEPEILRILGLS